MTFLPEAIRLFEEFDDELNGFEINKSTPCVFYCCGSGVDGVTGNFGCFYSRVPCGGKANARMFFLSFGFPSKY